MTDHQTASEEAGLAAKFAAVGLIGLAVDATLLRAGLFFGLSAAVARIISLICAMQVTFAINGLRVFHCLTRAKLAKQWAGYMAANGLGNLCNFWIFVALISLHDKVVSNAWVALATSSCAAYVINYAGTRLLVFGAARRGSGRLSIMPSGAMESVCGPTSPESRSVRNQERRVPATG